MFPLIGAGVYPLISEVGSKSAEEVFSLVSEVFPLVSEVFPLIGDVNQTFRNCVRALNDKLQRLDMPIKTPL